MTTLVPGWRPPFDPGPLLHAAVQHLTAFYTRMPPPEAALRRTLAEYAQALYEENLSRLRSRTQGVGALLCAALALGCLHASWGWPALVVGGLGLVCVSRWWTALGRATQWRGAMERRWQTMHRALHEPDTREIAEQIYRELPHSTFAHLSTFLSEVLHESQRRPEQGVEQQYPQTAEPKNGGTRTGRAR